ncbi:MAG: Druantia anti-phage system protein DruA [Pseudomonadota bacterium]
MCWGSFLTPTYELGFGAAAWQIAPRDQFIGWSHEQRQRNLPLSTASACNSP